MAETLSNVSVSSDVWVDVNTLSGITVGDEFDIVNTGISEVKLIEATTQPTISDTRGIVLTNRQDNYASVTVAAGSLKIWARSLSDITGTLSVQEA